MSLFRLTVDLPLPRGSESGLVPVGRGGGHRKVADGPVAGRAGPQAKTGALARQGVAEPTESVRCVDFASR